MSQPFAKLLHRLQSPDLLREGRVLLVGGRHSGKSQLIAKFRDSWGTPISERKRFDENAAVRIPLVLDVSSYRGGSVGKIWANMFEFLSREIHARIDGLPASGVPMAEMDAAKFAQELRILLGHCRCQTIDVVVVLDRLHLLAQDQWLGEAEAEVFFQSLKGVWEAHATYGFAWLLSGSPALLIMAEKLARMNLPGSTWLQEAEKLYLYNLCHQQTNHVLRGGGRVDRKASDDEMVGWIQDLTGGQIKLVDAFCKAVHTAQENGSYTPGETWRDEAADALLKRCSNVFGIWRSELSASALAYLECLNWGEVISPLDEITAIECACTGIAVYDAVEKSLVKVNKLFWQWYSTQAFSPSVLAGSKPEGANSHGAVEGIKKQFPQPAPQETSHIYFDWNQGCLYDNKQCKGAALENIKGWRSDVLKLFFTRLEDNTIGEVSADDFSKILSAHGKTDIDDARRKIAHRLGGKLGLDTEAIIGKCKNGHYPRGKKLHLKEGQEEYAPHRDEFLSAPVTWKTLRGYRAR